MLLRALVFYLAIFPVCADTEVIEYLIPEEVMGVYQSPYAFHGIGIQLLPYQTQTGKIAR